jgi:transcriptional regulator with XRE-family HTH domain
MTATVSFPDNTARMATKPNPIDIHVGRRLRLRRTLLGMSQERLGELLGLTFQQVQKYERGVNRIGSSRLFELGQILDVPVSFFFDDMPEAGAGAAASHHASGLAEESAAFEHNMAPDLPLDRRETLELVRAYYRIPDPAVRKRLFELAKALANLDDPAKRGH